MTYKINSIQSLFSIRIKLTGFLLAGLFVFISCHRNEKRYVIDNPSPYYSAFFTGGDQEVLRGINFNVTADVVKKTEQAKLYESAPDHLFYEFSFEKDSTAFAEYANVQYFFDENNLLDIITVDIFLNDSLQQNRLNASVTQYFTQRYRDAETDVQNYRVWKGEFEDSKTEKTQNFSVALKELDNDYGLSIEYLRE